MNREEFLTILRQQLEGEMPDDEIYGHLSYYSDYIRHETDSGKSEEEVLDCLGDPRLIARTLIDADEAPQNYRYEEVRTDYRYEDDEHEGTSHTVPPFQSTDDRTEGDRQSRPHTEKSWHLHIHPVLARILGALILIGILVLVVTVVRVLLPLIIVVILVCVVVSLLRNWW